MRAVIISNGSFEGIDIHTISSDVDMIVCADGGAKHIINTGIIPTVIVGDMDSIDENVLKTYEDMNIKLYKHPVKKDKTDTELAIDYAISNGATDITLLGATGTRLDHTLANIMLLYNLLKNNINARIVDSHNEISITDRSVQIEKKEYPYISLIPLTANENKVTLKGFEYETCKEHFKLGSSYGISNRFIDNKGDVYIEDGLFIIIKSKD